MKYLKPDSLKEGDAVAIVSPSAGSANKFPYIFDNGLKNISSLSLKIKEYSTARKSADHLYRNPKERALDINEAFANKEIKAIISSIGGDDSVRILPYLNKNVIRNNPKIIMGFSDFTTITTFVNQLGIVTFNGPSVMAGFAEMDSMPDYLKHVHDTLMSNTWNYVPYKQFSDGYLDWRSINNVGKVAGFKDAPERVILQGSGKIRGELFGGCIEVFEFMNGTEFFPKKSFFTNKILFFETSEEVPPPIAVERILRNFALQGMFDKASGIIFGRCRNYTKEMNDELFKRIKNIFEVEFSMPNFPIMMNLDFGHTDPQKIMPLGVKAEIDLDGKEFKLLELPLTN